MIKEIRDFFVICGKVHFVCKIVEDDEHVVGKLYKGFIDDEKEEKEFKQAAKTLIKK